MSFRWLVSRSFPRSRAAKLLLLVTILAGCGGSGGKTRVVSGDTFTFAAPVGWKVGRAARQVSAGNDRQVVQVSTLPLARAYTPALFGKVTPEIERVALGLKEQLHATFSGRTLEVAGERAWQYDFVGRDTVWQVTFVLRGKREYQLYCRRGKSDSSAPCSTLVSSFTPR